MKKERAKVIIVIPARYGSTRFEGKPLAEINGKPMIYHVYQRAKKVKCVDDVIVATDDERIENAVKQFNGKAVMTSKGHRSGTDRVAEVARGSNADIIVNVQGDEPLISPKAIEQAIIPLIENNNIVMSTLMTPITKETEYDDPNVVKVVTDNKGFALYFSRSLIPYPRGTDCPTVYKHIGVYVYRKDFLIRFAAMSQTSLERTEGLEQLRVLENGFKIKVVETDYDSISIDTPRDLEVIKNILDRENIICE